MINSSYLTTLVRLLNDLSLRCRLKTAFESEVSDWSDFVISPSEGYIETSCTGPVATKDLLWIEINPVKEKHIGRLVTPKKEDLGPVLFDLLNKNLIPFEKEGGLIRIPVNKG